VENARFSRMNGYGSNGFFPLPQLLFWFCTIWLPTMCWLVTQPFLAWA
jgi:hypothetical protein